LTELRATERKVSTAKTLVLGVLGLGLTPCLARAQSVVVTHTVHAEVMPLASVRDSAWAKTHSDRDAIRWTWTAELRANIASELHVLGPVVDDSTARVRVGAGPSVRLQPRMWNTVSILGAGKQHITIEYSTADSVSSPGPPDVRIR
jgi:hypothetical protein